MSEETVDRRDILKGTGAAISGAALLGGSGAVSADSGSLTSDTDAELGATLSHDWVDLQIWVQPLNDDVSDYAVSLASKAINDMLNQIRSHSWDYDVVLSWDIQDDIGTIVDKYPNISEDDIDTDCCDNPVDPDDINDKNPDADLVFVVKSNGRWANATSTNGDLEDIGAWNDSVGIPWAAAGPVTDDGDLRRDGDCYDNHYPAIDLTGVEDDERRFQGAVMQETGHFLIHPDHSGDGGSGHHGEHGLGIIRDDGSSTPMLTFYEDERANVCEGDEHSALGGDRSTDVCGDNSDWDGTVSLELSDCTLDAISETLQNEF